MIGSLIAKHIKDYLSEKFSLEEADVTLRDTVIKEDQFTLESRSAAITVYYLEENYEDYDTNTVRIAVNIYAVTNDIAEEVSRKVYKLLYSNFPAISTDDGFMCSGFLEFKHRMNFGEINGLYVTGQNWETSYKYNPCEED
jgi:hypothetical protein